jgi:hypothetical protein
VLVGGYDSEATKVLGAINGIALSVTALRTATATATTETLIQLIDTVCTLSAEDSRVGVKNVI